MCTRTEELAFGRSGETPPLDLRAAPHFGRADIQIEDIDSENVRAPPPWEESHTFFDLSLTQFKKDCTANDIFKQEFFNLKNKYKDFSEIFTDGSKDGMKVGAAAFIQHENRK